MDRSILTRLRHLEAQTESQRVKAEHEFSERLGKITAQCESSLEYARKLKTLDGGGVLGKMGRQLEELQAELRRAEGELEETKRVRREQEHTAVREQSEEIELTEMGVRVAEMEASLESLKAEQQYLEAISQELSI